MEIIALFLGVSMMVLMLVYRLLVALDVVHEHSPATGMGFDGASLTSTCKCGERIMQDSQGGWF